MERNRRILILVPAPTARGGISNYYQVLRDEFPEYVEYFYRGARKWPKRTGFFSEFIRALNDYFEFRKRIAKKDISLIQSSTSLGLATTIRDGLFLRFAKRKGLKTIVFFRGWDHSSEKFVIKYLYLFKYFFFHSDRIITLSQKTKIVLKEWGYKGEISVETTVVDRKLINGVNEKSIINKYERKNKGVVFNLLFVSRIETRKGIYELLEAFNILTQNSGGQVKYYLTICGDGSELEKIKIFIETKKISRINVEGFIEGDRKRDVYEKADIFIFPSHEEGMPNALLEAMGFGLPVITTPVGGIIDFFVPGENGLYIEKNNPEDIVNKINMLLSDLELLRRIALNNFKKGKEYFRSDKVSERVQAIYKEILIS